MNNENQERLESAGAKQETSASSLKCLFNESLRGLKVIAADGKAVGEVDDLTLVTGTWRAESVHLKLNKTAADDLGVPRGRIHAGTIDVPVHMIQSVGDSVILSVPSAQLRPTLSGPSEAAA